MFTAERTSVRLSVVRMLLIEKEKMMWLECHVEVQKWSLTMAKVNDKLMIIIYSFR